jgi:steroid delta-isomerase-like uncharacterized protein
MITEDVRARREKLVRDHMHDEVVHEWDSVLSTFPHPRYEVVPSERVYDGDAAVRGYYDYTRAAFPDQRHEVISVRHSDDAVIIEFYVLGTHLGPLGAIPPTGGTFKVRSTAFFVFDGDVLVTERIYFDQLTVLRQVLRGVRLKSPSGIWTLLRVLRGFAAMSREPRDTIPD